MPSPARLANRSVLYLRKAGHDEITARRILREVIESLASGKDDWEPWALEWWRKLWAEASGTGTTARTPATEKETTTHE